MYTLRGIKPVWVGGDPRALCACVHKRDALSSLPLGASRIWSVWIFWKKTCPVGLLSAESGTKLQNCSLSVILWQNLLHIAKQLSVWIWLSLTTGGCIDFCRYLFTYLFLFYNFVVTEFMIGTAKQKLARKTAHNKLTTQTVVSLWLRWLTVKAKTLLVFVPHWMWLAWSVNFQIKCLFIIALSPILKWEPGLFKTKRQSALFHCSILIYLGHPNVLQQRQFHLRAITDHVSHWFQFLWNVNTDAQLFLSCILGYLIQSVG